MEKSEEATNFVASFLSFPVLWLTDRLFLGQDSDAFFQR